MRHRGLPAAFALAIVLALLVPTAAAAQGADDLTVGAGTITRAESFDAAKSASGKLAKTDPSLLGQSSSELINVLVKLDYDAIASYKGGIAGLSATSPSVTGKAVADNRRAVAAYRSYVTGIERAAVRSVDARIARATVGTRLRLAYGGFALQLPANQVGTLLAIDGVAAVQRDVPQQPLALEEPYQFIGAEAVWNQLDGPVLTGQGVVVANLDTGIWPENPMFEDKGLPSPPGGPYGCQFGLSGDANDPAFACNDKVIGAYAFTDTYTTFLGAEAGEYCDTVGLDPDAVCSARDADGHGTHTLTTAAGDFVDTAEMWGIDRGPTSGMAPGAHVIGYRVCLDQGCFPSDSIAAVGQAIVDDVDVINFSIGGGANAFTDGVELAFLDAYASGILVNASAGNEGPGAATAGHAGPWTNTVGASYPSRIYEASVHLAADNGDVLDATGVTITPGIGTPTPVIRPSAVAGYTGNNTCNVPFAAGSVTGQHRPVRSRQPGRSRGFRLQRAPRRRRGDAPRQRRSPGPVHRPALAADDHGRRRHLGRRGAAGDGDQGLRRRAHGRDGDVHDRRRHGADARHHDDLLLARAVGRLDQARRDGTGYRDPRGPEPAAVAGRDPERASR